MATSSGSVDPATAFSFSTNTTPFVNISSSSSFSDHDTAPTTNVINNNRRGGVGGGLSLSGRTCSGVPKFKSIPPPSLPISPPSSYFTFPYGLSPSELLDSPVLLPSSDLLPSPTTGTFPAQTPYQSSNSMFPRDQTFIGQQQQLQHQAWNFLEIENKYDFSSGKSELKSEFEPLQSYSPEIASLQTNSQTNNEFQSTYNNNYQQPAQSIREQKRSDDGYNWRKYGQKQVKGSENPRSYFKCTFPNCPTKKNVERSLDGQITEIVYKGSHNHPKPQSTRRQSSNASQSIQAPTHTGSEVHDQSFVSHGGSTQMDSATTPENSSISMGDDDVDQTSEQKSKSGDDFDEDEPDTKRWKKGSENEIISAPGSRTVREPRVVVQTTSDIDILDDGYRWRKYGQKVVKGNPNPRSYYKCTYPGCQVRKHVERASHDLRAVITTYEGKHNHDVPAARGSGSGVHSINRPPLPVTSDSNNSGTTLRPLPMMNNSNRNNFRVLPTSESQAPFTLEMLQSPERFGLSGFGNANIVGSYMNQQPQQADNGFSRTKEEPRDDLFLESLLC